jgi:2-oxo-4-hydroxy-4-carboxy-5-ureidoimidazoline decarboxylase
VTDHESGIVSIDHLSSLPQEEFIAALDGVYEHSPWVPASAWQRRPFRDIGALHRACSQSVREADRETQHALIRAHPELAGKAAIAGELTDDSTREQSGAGLDRCLPDEFRRLTELNRDYAAKFGFPFIIAVRGHTLESIIAALEERLRHSHDAEFKEALRQIDQIALFRLQARVRENPAQD